MRIGKIIIHLDTVEVDWPGNQRRAMEAAHIILISVKVLQANAFVENIPEEVIL